MTLFSKEQAYTTYIKSKTKDPPPKKPHAYKITNAQVNIWPLLRVQAAVNSYASEQKKVRVHRMHHKGQEMTLKRLRTTNRRQHQNERSTLDMIASNPTTLKITGINNKL